MSAPVYLPAVFRFRLFIFFALVSIVTDRIYAQITSVDTGSSGAVMSGWDEVFLKEWGSSQPWLRIRDRPYPGKLENSERVAREVVGLNRLSELGFKPVPVYWWGSHTWHTGVRFSGSSGRSLPIDLREAYRRGYEYGKAYGAVVAAFEIENEPDIGFVKDNAETYMAFQKAVYLGLKRGSLEAEIEDLPSPRLWQTGRRSELGDRTETAEEVGGEPLVTRSQGLGASRPFVVMAPLALPPGPYFEQLVENGLFSYTDAFNYHYYGYAEDFSGVYGQFSDAVRELNDKQKAISRNFSRFSTLDSAYIPTDELSTVSLEPRVKSSRSEAESLKLNADASVKISLPVLLTEYGYGSLGDPDRNMVEGRVRQWRWFKSVGEQIHQLKIAGPMAFYLPPYLERGALEFGLTVRSEDGTLGDDVGRGLRTPPNDFEKAGGGDPALQFSAGGLSYKPSDFGLSKPEPWMEQIGRKFGDNEATPALAWLYDYGRRHPYPSKDWTVYAPPPSPVVIDFISGSGLVQMKRYGGYVVKGDGRGKDDEGRNKSGEGRKGGGGWSDGQNEITHNPLPIINDRTPQKTGSGELVLYNFSEQSIRGRLVVAEGRDLISDVEVVERERVLDPMARVLIPIEVNVPAETFAMHKLKLNFVTSGSSLASGLRKTSEIDPIQKSKSSSISPLAHSVFATAFYPTATGMQETIIDNFSSGSDESVGNAALLESRHLASEEPRLRANGRWLTTSGVEVEEAADGSWKFAVRSYPTAPKRVAMAELPLPDDFEFPDEGMMKMSYSLVDPPRTDIKTGQSFELYFRTANGNLFQVWPRQYATARWRGYTEVKDNYTMAFYGRSNLPWRFRDNRPVALVFFFRPSVLPATYEVRHARIVKLRARN